MIRVLKSNNERYAQETLKKIQDYIAVGRSTDSVELREFKDGAGQPVFEIWLQHTKDHGHKA